MFLLWASHSFLLSGLVFIVAFNKPLNSFHSSQTSALAAGIKRIALVIYTICVVVITGSTCRKWDTLLSLCN